MGPNNAQWEKFENSFCEQNCKEQDLNFNWWNLSASQIFYIWSLSYDILIPEVCH